MALNRPAGAPTPRVAAASPLAQRIMASTTKGDCGPAILLLADGTVFYGRACGAAGTATGEVCFNTSLEGYFEVLTDPSYAGQIVTMTYPQIGNYGIDPADVQSAFPGDTHRAPATPALRGMVVRDMCRTPSNWRSALSVPEYLEQQGIVGIEGVDTRALVQHLRDHGAQMGIVSTEEFDLAVLADKLAAAPQLVGENLVQTVSSPEAHPFTADDLPPAHEFALSANATRRAPYRVVAYDCGVKRGILEGLVRAGCSLTVVPWNTPASEVLSMNPDGVFLSNGPGDPDAVEETYAQVQELLGKVPVFGICLGHQMISLAAGAQIEKLKFGHRGGNQPVMNLLTRRVEITAQNHGFGLVFPSLARSCRSFRAALPSIPPMATCAFGSSAVSPPWWRTSALAASASPSVNLNDGTAEGIQLLDHPAFSVQYHPEASPGPTDAHYLFTAFTRLMDGESDYLNIDIASDRLHGWSF